MDSQRDIKADLVKLLSTLDLEGEMELIASLVLADLNLKALAISIWDRDLERFGDTALFGPKKQELAKFAAAFAESAELDELSKDALFELDVDETEVPLPKELEPVTCYRAEHEGELIACFLLAGLSDTEGESKKTLAWFSQFPFGKALANAWEYKELLRENQRLRGQYEEMEDKTSSLEDQTRKLIHDLTANNAIRTKHLEREKLIYSISNAVRSTVDIRTVLETTVQKIGELLGASRCLLLRATENADQMTVFEYTDQVKPVRDLFMTEAGIAFTQQALKKENPQNIEDPDRDPSPIYEAAFLRQFDLRSGLLVPLVMREQVLGTIFVQDCLVARDWSIDDISLLGSLSDNLSVAIENAELHAERERQAVTDGLTGVANRRCFTDTFAREFERAKRYEQSLSLVIVDLDFLKKINDTYGHQTGDEAIRTIGKVLKQSSRSIDLPARYGGEEFCLLLPNTEVGMAEQLAERLRRLILETPVEGPGSITASLGVACYPLHAEDADSLFARADEALYSAKQEGRNRVKVAIPMNKGDSEKQSSKILDAR